MTNLSTTASLDATKEFVDRLQAFMRSQTQTEDASTPTVPALGEGNLRF